MLVIVGFLPGALAGSAIFNSPVSGDAARQAAEQELRRSEYHRDDPGLFSRVINWVLERLGGLFSGTPAGSATLLFVVLLAAVIAFAIVRARSNRRIARAERSRAADPLAPAGGVDHRRRAIDFTARKQYDEALREWLRAAVQVIEDRGVLDQRPGRTGDEIAREAGRLLPSAAEALSRATIAFDDIWFGGRAGTESDATLGQKAADAARSARIERSSGAAPSGYAVPR